MWPWQKNEQLIKALFSEVQNLKGEVATLSKNQNDLALITRLKNEIAGSVLSGIRSDLPTNLARLIMEEIKKQQNAQPRPEVV
jgi:hypothetical protein